MQRSDYPLLEPVHVELHVAVDVGTPRWHARLVLDKRVNRLLAKRADLIDGFAKIVVGDHTPAAALAALNLNADQRRILTLAADQPLMEVSFALTIHDSRGDHVAMASAAVTDTVEGRIVTGPILGEDRTWWTQIVPGTPDAGGSALRALVATVGTTWEGHSRFK